LNKETIEFIGHALALHNSDDYLSQPALDTVLKIKLYSSSLLRFNTNSPYIYPRYGLGEMPQAFSRLSAIYGGTYILRKPLDKIELDTSGHITGVTSQGETAKCKFVVGDPSYFSDRVEKIGDVVRAICLLNHPVSGTNNADSAQIIFPQAQLGRKSDIYMSIISNVHNVVPKGMWAAVMCTNVETKSPATELEPVLKMVSPIVERFVWITPTYRIKDNGKISGIFISKSYDATTHFETQSQDVLDLWERITGSKLDLTPTKRPVEGAGAGAGGSSSTTSSSTASKAATTSSSSSAAAATSTTTTTTTTTATTGSSSSGGSAAGVTVAGATAAGVTAAGAAAAGAVQPKKT